MATIIFKGWNNGMRSIPFMFLLKEKAGLSLTIAMDIKTRVLDNEEIELQISDPKVAEEIVYEARQLGVNSSFSI